MNDGIYTCGCVLDIDNPPKNCPIHKAPIEKNFYVGLMTALRAVDTDDCDDP